MTLTNKLPDKPGFYWWTDGCESPCIVEITELENGELYVESPGCEISFNINIADEDDYWGYIPYPKVPKKRI